MTAAVDQYVRQTNERFLEFVIIFFPRELYIWCVV